MIADFFAPRPKKFIRPLAYGELRHAQGFYFSEERLDEEPFDFLRKVMMAALMPGEKLVQILSPRFTGILKRRAENRPCAVFGPLTFTARNQRDEFIETRLLRRGLRRH